MVKDVKHAVQLDNPSNPELVTLLPSDEQMTKDLEAILDDSEITVGYEDNSHIVPINSVSTYEAVPKIIAYIRRFVG